MKAVRSDVQHPADLARRCEYLEYVLKLAYLALHGCRCPDPVGIRPAVLGDIREALEVEGASS